MGTQDRLIKKSFIAANAHQLKDTEINLIYKFMKVTLETEKKPVLNFQCSDGLDRIAYDMKAYFCKEQSCSDSQDRQYPGCDIKPCQYRDRIVEDLIEIIRNAD